MTSKSRPPVRKSGRANVSKRIHSPKPTAKKPTVTLPPITSAEVWAYYFPPKRSRLTVARTEAEKVWNHFTQKDAIIFTFLGVLTLVSIGII